MSTKILGPAGEKAFEGRKIGLETVVRFGVYTAKRGIEKGSTIPSEKGNIVVFPFVENGKVVNEKFRGPDKTFWQTPGGRRTFWNSDILDDPALQDGRHPLIITEGELDALTAIDCGFPFTVSVPDGAPPPPKNPEGERKDQPSDQSGKFEFMWNNRDRLKRIKRFIIAVDNDANGQQLASELVRRLSASRCMFVTYPEGCKDLNDVQMQHGPDAVAEVINTAQFYPVKDLYTLHDYPEAGPIQTFTTGWEMLDTRMQLFFPSFTVVTGIPSHGKSSWITNLLINAAENHGWKSAIFSPEMPVVPHLRDKMRRIRGRMGIDEMTHDDRTRIDSWLAEHFYFIEYNDDDTENDLTLEWLIDKAEEAVLRYGVRAFVIDPWNEIEHAKRRDETTTEYIARALRLLKRFQRKYEIALFILAHPTKDVASGGKSRAPTLYDIDGSAAWFNKPDIGVVIERPDANVDESMIHIAKVRFEGTGTKGSIRMRFDWRSSRYEHLDGRSESMAHYKKA